MDIRSQLDELQDSDDRRQKQTSEKRKKIIDRLNELIDKNHSIVTDLLQENQKSEQHV